MKNIDLSYMSDDLNEITKLISNANVLSKLLSILLLNETCYEFDNIEKQGISNILNDEINKLKSKYQNILSKVNV